MAWASLGECAWRRWEQQAEKVRATLAVTTGCCRFVPKGFFGPSVYTTLVHWSQSWPQCMRRRRSPCLYDCSWKPWPPCLPWWTLQSCLQGDETAGSMFLQSKATFLKQTSVSWSAGWAYHLVWGSVSAASLLGKEQHICLIFLSQTQKTFISVSLTSP